MGQSIFKLAAFALLEKGNIMGQIISDAFGYAIESTKEFWIAHYPGYLRTFIAIIVFGIIGTIVAEIYEKYEEHRKRRLIEKDGE